MAQASHSCNEVDSPETQNMIAIVALIRPATTTTKATAVNIVRLVTGSLAISRTSTLVLRSIDLDHPVLREQLFLVHQPKMQEI
jgi:hypothetical protein